jgi:pimeloyl-ACP methyl ester carboxylesterase
MKTQTDTKNAEATGGRFAVLKERISHPDEQWLTLPATPTLPKATRSGYAPVNGIKLWYAVFGRGEPLFLLHGGLANSNYWGNQVPALAKHHQVIVMDSRGHGRSYRDKKPFSYHVLASDVVGMMEFLKIKKASIAGWGDGADVGLDLAMRHPDRVTKLFAFASNTDPNALRDLSHSPVFNAYITRTEKEYERTSPTPGEYIAFLNQIGEMWATGPNFSAGQLESIKVPVWIVDADHEEGVKRENTLFIADHIPGAALLIQAAVSHFSFLQDPRQFNEDLLHFME